MSDNVRQRYSFRLTEEDQDIHDFLVSSKETNSETIRKLLKFALVQINQEKDREQKQQEYEELQREINLIRDEQNKGFKKILDKLDHQIIQNNSKTADIDCIEEESVEEKSVDNSIHSMLDSFGMFE